ncbi:Nucleotide-bindingalpha-beta plait [Penicillium diatomitis]|uniref:Nucleotide-bindingalpha-beta plait n=1 Tax=Penicillium diatomitis TaxID=2819901 RepID=A0A9W9XLA2_9EURO|nr:Nucleotide-bindingalpha-beta plait [Penicillium diatomitis]KAJ5494968.1 Nucleotide-bindingalpha-beta plait [Penicillium diatomitis]
MNAIRQTQALNKRELENAVPPEASWHADYRDTAYIYIGGLPLDLSEGDIITIFSQYGEPVHINLLRDKETGKSRGFAFLKYEDQRSTDLAVDNLGGATVLGRMLRVDHARYKRRDDEEEGDNVARLMGDPTTSQSKDDGNDDRHGRKGPRDNETKEARPMLKEERELQDLIQNHDDEDPMKEFLIEEKKEEVALALANYRESKRSSHRRDDSRDRSSRHHRHHRRHRSRSAEHRHRRDRSRSKEKRPRRRSAEREPESRKDSTAEHDERHRRTRTGREDQSRGEHSVERSRSSRSRRNRSERDRHDHRR